MLHLPFFSFKLQERESYVFFHTDCLCPKIWGKMITVINCQPLWQCSRQWCVVGPYRPPSLCGFNRPWANLLFMLGFVAVGGRAKAFWPLFNSWWHTLQHIFQGVATQLFTDRVDRKNIENGFSSANFLHLLLASKRQIYPPRSRSIIRRDLSLVTDTGSVSHSYSR